MKFLLEFVACYGPCSSEEKQRPAEETGLLVVQQQTRRPAERKQARSKGGSGEWRPSLSSISEEVLVVKRMKHSVERPIAGWRKSLERKVSSMSRRDRNRYLDHDERRRTPSSYIVPAFAPTPFMF